MNEASRIALNVEAAIFDKETITSVVKRHLGQLRWNSANLNRRNVIWREMLVSSAIRSIVDPTSVRKKVRWKQLSENERELWIKNHQYSSVKLTVPPNIVSGTLVGPKLSAFRGLEDELERLISVVDTLGIQNRRNYTQRRYVLFSLLKEMLMNLHWRTLTNGWFNCTS